MVNKLFRAISPIITSISAFLYKRNFMPIVFLFLSLTMIAYGEVVHNVNIMNFSGIFFLLSLLITLLSIGVFLVKKKWSYAVISSGFIIVTLFSLKIIFFLVDFFPGVTRDGFADNLTIPSGLEIYEQIGADGQFQETANINTLQQTSFSLFHSEMTGMYKYEVWLGKIEPGEVYLKAYEITQNYRLSKNRLKGQSSIKVENTSDEYIRFQNNGFTIYEGDWDYPYAARFEVWFILKNGEERKLLEKNYKIEGFSF